MNAVDIRCVNDLTLYEKLSNHTDVKRVNKIILKAEHDGTTGIRRNLLATSVRLTTGMAPEIARTADECIERLGVALPLELCVYSSP